MALNKINGDLKENGLSNKDFNKGIKDDSTVTASALVDNNAIMSTQDEKSSTASAQDESYAGMIDKIKFDFFSTLQKITEKSMDPVCKEMNGRRLSELMFFHLPPIKGEISEPQIISYFDRLEKRVILNEDFVCEFMEYFKEIVTVFRYVETVGTSHLPPVNQIVILINLIIVRQEMTLKIKWLNIVIPNLERAHKSLHTIGLPDSSPHFDRLLSLSQRIEMVISPLKSCIETLGKYKIVASTIIAFLENETGLKLEIPPLDF